MICGNKKTWCEHTEDECLNEALDLLFSLPGNIIKNKQLQLRNVRSSFDMANRDFSHEDPERIKVAHIFRNSHCDHCKIQRIPSITYIDHVTSNEADIEYWTLPCTQCIFNQFFFGKLVSLFIWSSFQWSLSLNHFHFFARQHPLRSSHAHSDSPVLNKQANSANRPTFLKIKFGQSVHSH